MAKKKPAKKAPKKAAARKPAPKKTAPKSTASAGLNFNHAMIYAKDVARGAAFYKDILGFKMIEEFAFEQTVVYARLRAPAGEGTIAIHQANPGANITSDGVRLYFEIAELDEFCEKLRKRGFYFTQLPRMMPWGWRHAYLNDPDGHEISLYWAGEKRFKKTVMKAAREVEKTPEASKRR